MSAINSGLFAFGLLMGSTTAPCYFGLQDLLERGSGEAFGIGMGDRTNLTGSRVPWLDGAGRFADCRTFDTNGISVYASDSPMFEFGKVATVLITRGIPSRCTASGKFLDEQSGPTIPITPVLRRDLQEWANVVSDDESTPALDAVIGSSELQSSFCAEKTILVKPASEPPFDRNVVVCAAFGKNGEAAVHIRITETR